MKKHITYISLLIGTLSFAQIEQGETTVNRDQDFEQQSVTVQRKYEPKVEAAEKIKQTPQIDSVAISKLPVDYALKDVEAESDFETSTIGAEELPVSDKNPYNNYIRLGYGNRATLILDGFAEYAMDTEKSVGGSLSYFSTNGEIPEVDLATSNSKLQAEGFFKMNFENARADVRLGGGMHKLNYYGTFWDAGVNQLTANDDVSQRYTNVYTSGKYETFNHPFLDEVNLKAGFFGDKYDASETNFDATAKFGRENLTELAYLGDMSVGASAKVNLNFANSKFKNVIENTFSQMTVGITPLLHFGGEIVRLKAGANLQYNTESKADVSDFHIFPMAEVFVTAVPEFGLYGGILGGVKQNRFQGMYDENPYLLPSQNLKSTINKMEVYVGVRGDIGANFKYDASAKYQNLENVALFSRYTQIGAPYMHANSFVALYDNGKRTAIEGTINYLGISNLNLGGNLLFQGYSMDNFQEAWGKPVIQATISADYKLLDERLILGGDVFYVDNRKVTEGGVVFYDPSITSGTGLPSYNLKPYIDLNVNATYLILDRWAAFIEIQNALNKNYDRFLDYPVTGVTAVGGVMFKF